MSELSFKTYCIENYAEYKNISSSSVFEKFLNSKLLQHLKTDYEDLHGMGVEALMQFFDEYLAKSSRSFDTTATERIEHNLVRATVIPEIVKILCHYYNISEDEALKRFYESATGANFADDETGLYGQSALHIAGLFIVEQDGDLDHSRL